MSIVCKQCGYENPDGSTICEICAEELNAVPANNQPVNESVQSAPQMRPITQSLVNDQQTYIPNVQNDVDDGYEYFVHCQESGTRTFVANGNVTSFFCEGCKVTHEIDGAWWQIERREKAKVATDTKQTESAVAVSNSVGGNNLWLEEINSHERIEIDKQGGTLGRYGKYGANFFTSRNLLTVSGEHCSFSYEYNNWVIRHMSKTNQTMYNNMILGHGEPNILEDGKVLTLANAVTFIVRIG